MRHRWVCLNNIFIHLSKSEAILMLISYFNNNATLFDAIHNDKTNMLAAVKILARSLVDQFKHIKNVPCQAKRQTSKL
jgi:hypothetical protein